MTNYLNTVQTYFEEKADQYDNVDKQAYWRLSDRLLWTALNKFVLNNLPRDFKFCDAGGGTGRWSLKILENYDHAKGTTIDISPYMLAQAAAKREKNNLNDRWHITEGDLHNLSAIEDESYDLVFNFHNVIGFVENPQQVIAELKRILKPNGILCTLAPNAYHAGYFNLKNADVEEAAKAINQKGRFTKQMPDIHLFTPKSAQDLMTEAGLETIKITGFPCIVYPGYAETQLHGQTESLSSLLEQDDAMEAIYKIEESLIDQDDIAARGNNIFVIARK